MRGSLITTTNELLALKEQWAKLSARCRGTVFQSFEWGSTWWSIFSSRFQLRALAIWNDETLVGFLPCFLQPLGPPPVRMVRLRLLGEYRIYGEYEPLIDPEYSQACLSLAADFLSAELRERRCHLVDFRHFSATSESARALLNLVDCREFLPAFTPRNLPRITLRLPPDFDSYMRGLSYNERGLIRRHERALLKHGATIEVLTGRSLVDAFPDFVALHRKTWLARGEKGFFVEGGKFEQFHRTVASRLSERGIPRLYFVRTGTARIAALYAFFLHGTCCLYLSGRDPEHRLGIYGPGKVLMAAAIRDAIKEGCTFCDLTEGTDRYKFQMGGELDWYGRFTIARRSRLHPLEQATPSGQAAQ